MQQKWGLKVEEFAKIKKAEIEISPFLVFIGENNSGKSYLMTLLWGIYVLGRNIFFKEPPNVGVYKHCLEIIETAINDRVEEIELTKEHMQKFLSFYNYVLDKNKNKLLKELFSTDKIKIRKIEIINYERKKNLKIKFLYNKELQRVSSGKDYIKFPVSEITKQEKYKIIQYICWKLLMQDLNSSLFPYNYYDKKIDSEPLFLPASRTGFMLTYKALTSDVMNAWGVDSQIDTKFTLPVIKFLQALIRQKSSKNYPKEIIEFLENEILKGNIISKEKIVNEYSYKPKNLKNDIPLFITSSLVAELSPLVIFLKSNLRYKSIFIEELEAHLHPKIQKIITRAVIKLVNKKYPVVITTHSDVIFQHINNMIKLHYSKNKDELLKRLEYDEDDIINPYDIKVYEFKIVDYKTEVRLLKLTKEGFEVPSFNKALIELANETMILSESLGDV